MSSSGMKLCLTWFHTTSWFSAWFFSQSHATTLKYQVVHQLGEIPERGSKEETNRKEETESDKHHGKDGHHPVCEEHK